MKTNIVLIGFMGTGKTAVGKRLAIMLNKEFYDTDQEVEAVTEMTISQLFAKYGEIRFRSEEKLAVKRIASKDNSVISTGGGVVLDRENIDLLTEKGILICLTAKPEIIYERVKKRNNRPLLKKDNLYQTILGLMAEREKLYRCADFYLDTSDLNFEEIIEHITAFLKDYQGKGKKKVEDNQ